MTAATEPPTPRCPGCDHGLDTLPAGRCPECGRPFDPADPATLRHRFVAWRYWLPAVAVAIVLGVGGWAGLAYVVDTKEGFAGLVGGLVAAGVLLGYGCGLHGWWVVLKVLAAAGAAAWVGFIVFDPAHGNSGLYLIVAGTYLAIPTAGPGVCVGLLLRYGLRRTRFTQRAYR